MTGADPSQARTRTQARDALLDALFPGGHALMVDAAGAVSGHATTAGGIAVGLVGIADGMPVGIDAALSMAETVLAHVERGGDTPLLVLVDTASQVMARRDELLGLNDYLAHLCQCLALASFRGHRTIGILHGAAAAGAFIATALSTDRLVAVPGAAPSVMDLPSIARVTKLPLDRLERMAASTPIFAPGLDPLAATGAVHERWTDPARYAASLDAMLAADMPVRDGLMQDGLVRDGRDALGEERGGRRQARAVAGRVIADATARG